MRQVYNEHDIGDLVIHQLKTYWLDIDEKTIRETIPNALHQMNINFREIQSERFSHERIAAFDPLISIHWMIFLYRLSHLIYKSGGGTASDQVYYLNKIMHAIDWFYEIELPIHFLCEHPLGSVLGKAQYGDYFLIYQGITVGGSIKNQILYYPSIGNHVVLFANSSILGKSIIGDNVIISAGTKIVNDTVPSNSIVFGESPNLIIKERQEKEIASMIDAYWR